MLLTDEMASDLALVYTDTSVTLYEGDALAILPLLASASVQLILVDPPYMGVKKAEAWDNQWPTRDAYLKWLRQLAMEWQRILAPNGSLYCFASPQMAAHVEVMLEEMFTVIQRITWRKPPFSTKAEMFDKDSCRMFFPASEAIIFCEHRNADSMAVDESGYRKQCIDLHAQVFGRVFGNYLKSEFERACVTQKQIAALFPSRTGGMTGCVSNWLIGYNQPTADQYTTMRDFLNNRGGEYSYLRKDYESLRKDYESLRKDYESLRRPFTVSAKVPYTDVWEFATVSAGKAKHPCEKPLPLLRHIITASSRPGDTVLDCMAGSCNTLEAARQCGRKNIGIEADPAYVALGVSMLRQQQLF